MCTVTYIPSVQNFSFVLTSNRDEKSFRATIPPVIYEYDELKLCFPKDAESGGSWIAMNNKGRVVCLLNGGFIAHNKEAFHTHSRGKVLHDLAQSSKYARDFFDSLSLKNTEPFTLITIDQEKDKITSFSEFIWDGVDKHFRELNVDTPHIWSSVTLYNAENRRLRKQWFRNFLIRHKTKLSEHDILDFHSNPHSNSKEIDLVMQRDNGIKTVSITQITSNGRLGMSYNDLLTKNTYLQNI